LDIHHERFPPFEIAQNVILSPPAQNAQSVFSP